MLVLVAQEAAATPLRKLEVVLISILPCMPKAETKVDQTAATPQTLEVPEARTAMEEVVVVVRLGTVVLVALAGAMAIRGEIPERLSQAAEVVAAAVGTKMVGRIGAAVVEEE